LNESGLFPKPKWQKIKSLSLDEGHKLLLKFKTTWGKMHIQIQVFASTGGDG